MRPTRRAPAAFIPLFCLFTLALCLLLPARAADTGLDAGRKQAGIHAMGAEHALVGLVGVVVDEARVAGRIGTGFHGGTPEAVGVGVTLGLRWPCQNW
ncbi:hypothetical protein Tchl_3195 [Thauera chlorobenzoica]|uniref:Uncharacterized protein n=1 Tax=Thauera chlorobenzoica TaxID=96773 RepID=A0A1L6FGE5_9RHOO|nr:hypothetical protein Tchl_3195 [Thauera chlorobenzoica]